MLLSHTATVWFIFHANREDATQTGHILGPAQHLSKQATPERDLSPVACTIMRLIIHATLVWNSVCVAVRTNNYLLLQYLLWFIILGEFKYIIKYYTSSCKSWRTATILLATLNSRSWCVVKSDRTQCGWCCIAYSPNIARNVQFYIFPLVWLCQYYISWDFDLLQKHILIC